MAGIVENRMNNCICICLLYTSGNYNAHHVAYPEYDWKEFGNKFVAGKLGLEREEYTCLLYTSRCV